MNGQTRWFASDNNAATHPRVMEALSRANEGHAVGYGDDPATARGERAVSALFGRTGAADDPLVRFVLNGTGANVYALGCFAGQGDAVFCSDCAHILVDETGAPSAVTGAQLVPVRTRGGKIDPAALERAIAEYSDMHKPRPRVLSLSQTTELGTVYSPAELRELCDLAHGHGLFVHVDGARLSNAAAGLDAGPAEAAGDADAICFGGTKNGLMFGEAVVFMPRALPFLPDTARLRKTRLQLASKMRYIAAQFEEYARDGLWSQNASRANAMAARMADGARALGLRMEYPVDANALFVGVPRPVAEELRKARFFYDWEGGLVRWMASWDTTPEDVDGFLADLKAALDAYRASNPGRDPSEQAELDSLLGANRLFLRANWEQVERFRSDESLGIRPPPFNVAPPEGAPVVGLPDPLAAGLGTRSFADCVAGRRSRRKFTAASLSLGELSWLLWATGGVRDAREKYAFRTVPSGGCRHALDTLVYARRVVGLEPGLYRFVPVGHKLALLAPAAPLTGADADGKRAYDLDEAMDASLLGQLYDCAALFCWTAVPYRMEWRYTAAAAKIMLLDAGHACQNLYGACEALGLGTFALGAYDQALADRTLGLDGRDEFALYFAPVGRP